MSFEYIDRAGNLATAAATTVTAAASDVDFPIANA